MTNAEQMNTHLSSEQIAAFVDGRLREQQRRESENHFASCDECREVFLAVSDAVEEGVTGEEASKVVPIHPARKWPAVAALAAAAAVGVFFLPPVRNEIQDYRTGGISKLVRAAEFSDKRPIEGRLSGGFAHKAFSRPRGLGEQDGENLQLKIAAIDVEKASPSSAPDYRANAVIKLLVGKPNERTDAIPLLEKAVSLNGNDPSLLNDLAAAYIERGDYERAVTVAERAWSMEKTPEIAWNRALAYDDLEKRVEAIRAWEDYLKLDPDSAWSTEAKSKLDTLRNPF
jgi:tetratricopeptide (TPR) repeat protein